MKYRLAKNVTVVEKEEGIFLVSQSPLSLLRLNKPLAELAARAAGTWIAPAAEAEATVLEQLTAKGFVERTREPAAAAAELPTVSIVIPVKDREDELRRCLATIDLLSYPKDKLQVVVVDDGSRDASAAVAREAGAVVVASGGRGRGPAAARNAGARKATGEILAFIDSDCTASPEWLSELIPLFADPKMAAVGGRVDGLLSDKAIDRYEAAMSSLSLGSRERTGSSGDDTFYLPSCNLLVRRTAFASVAGFDDSMHVGEDVDLTWRLRDRGWAIVYVPKGMVRHEHRAYLRPFMSRRFDYGTSEGTLQRLHPHRHKRMVIPPLLALVLALLLSAPLVGWWISAVAAAILAADAVASRKRIARRGIELSFTTVFGGRLRALGSLVYYLSYHLVRYYAVPLILLSLIFPTVGLVTLGAVACAAGVDHAVRKPELGLIPFTAIYVLEQIAYGSGVFCGCLKSNTFASYRVALLRQAEA